MYKSLGVNIPLCSQRAKHAPSWLHDDISGLHTARTGGLWPPVASDFTGRRISQGGSQPLTTWWGDESWGLSVWCGLFSCSLGAPLTPPRFSQHSSASFPMQLPFTNVWPTWQSVGSPASSPLPSFILQRFTLIRLLYLQFLLGTCFPEDKLIQSVLLRRQEECHSTLWHTTVAQLLRSHQQWLLGKCPVEGEHPLPVCDCDMWKV